MTNFIYKIGVGLAIALLSCLLPMPYGYYTLVRFAAMVLFGCLAFTFYKEGKITLSVTAGSLALLFQPFAKIVLGRTIWNILDIIVAIALFMLWYTKQRNITK